MSNSVGAGCPIPDERIENAQESVIIFDLDDTLFPTTQFELFRLSSKFRNASLSIIVQEFMKLHVEEFFLLNKNVKLVLSNAISLVGVKNTYIITNANMEWISLVLYFFPACVDIISQIKLLSAKVFYQKINETSRNHGNGMLWKVYTILRAAADSFNVDINLDNMSSYINFHTQKQNELHNSVMESLPSLPDTSSSTTMKKTIMSFGDANNERIASKIVSNMINNVSQSRNTEKSNKIIGESKTIKFTTNPSFKQLHEELNWCYSNMQQICDFQEGLDMNIYE